MEPTKDIVDARDQGGANEVSRVPHAGFCALIVTALFLAILIVSADLVPALKNWLKENFFHHWIGKSMLALIVFVGSFLASLGFPWTKKRERLALFGAASVVIGAVLVTLGFFFYEAFMRH